MPYYAKMCPKFTANSVKTMHRSRIRSSGEDTAFPRVVAQVPFQRSRAKTEGIGSEIRMGRIEKVDTSHRAATASRRSRAMRSSARKRSQKDGSRKSRARTRSSVARCSRAQTAAGTLVERFGWRGIEPFELFRSEFDQNAVRILCMIFFVFC